ncbi:MAG: glycosyltransferase [Christensenellales bacterium]
MEQNKKLKIAVFTDSFYPGVGGTEQATLGLANALKNMNNDVVVCCPKFKGYDDSKFAFDVLRTNSIKLTDNDYMALPSVSGSFKKQIKNFKPDIIHCQSVSGMTRYALKYGKKYKIPVLITVHTKFKTAFSKNVKSKFIVNCMIKDIAKKLKRANGVFSVSCDMKNEISDYGYKNEVIVVKNGSTYNKIEIVEDDLQKIRQKYNLTKSDNILIFVGLIVKYKNIQFSLDALKIVKEKFPDFKFVIVGYGPDFDYFKKYVEKINLTENVIFTNKIYDKTELAGLYKISDLLLFPSVFDNDSLVVVEAAANQTPTITLENTGTSERLTNDVSGFVVKNDLQTYADKILFLLKNKDILKTVGINAEKMLPKSWDDTAKEYYDKYLTVIAKNDNKKD